MGSTRSFVGWNAVMLAVVVSLLKCTSTTTALGPTLRSLGRHDRAGAVQQSSLSSSLERPRPTLGLITFDLDDTLFPIGPVVEDANLAMVLAMQRLGYKESSNDAILKHTSTIRKQTKIPVTYTDLRKRAIRQELNAQAMNIDEELIHDSVVQYCFNAWLNERQNSAERNLFSGAVAMLEEISTLYPHACIGAITNGRGSPKGIESLEPYFDFCVSGEDEGVFPERKPRRGIYDASLAAYHERYPNPISDSRVWIHVGDCLANDVGGSVKCGAYAVWKAPHQEESSRLSEKQPKWSTASKRTIQNRRRLANQAKGMVSAEVTHLSELPTVVDEILELAASKTKQVAT